MILAGDLGPVYGFQWRHFGAQYKDMHTDYSGQGVDQLAKVIHTIMSKPNDRRIVMSAWNPVGKCSGTGWGGGCSDLSLSPSRYSTNGTSSLSFFSPVLCVQWRTLLPALPAFR